MQDELDDIFRVSKSAGIKIADIARYLCCSRSSLYNWRNGLNLHGAHRALIVELHDLLTKSHSPAIAFEHARAKKKQQ